MKTSAITRLYPPPDIRKQLATSTDEEFLDFLTTGLQENNRYGTNHLAWFNWPKLCRLLKEVGFSEVYRLAFGQSKFPPMRDVPLFDETLPFLSLDVEARK